MCGIAGFFLPQRRATAANVRTMCDRIRHRGPDDEGIYVDGGCGIGMRRLSIIDLSTGHQPISNEDGSVWVVFNGEVRRRRRTHSYRQYGPVAQFLNKAAIPSSFTNGGKDRPNPGV